MAGVLAARPLRSTFFRLTPEIRSIVAQTRSFSSTPSRKLTVADLAVAGPTAVLNGIHALGIPWYATLPLTAVLVRGTLVYYLSSRPGRAHAHTKAHLIPLINARADILLGTKYHQEMQEVAKDLADGKRHPRYTLIRWWARMEATNAIGKEYGAPLFTGRGLINFGMLITFTEAIRLKCGSPVGLVSILVSPLQWLAQKIDPERFPKPVEPEIKDPAVMMAERLASAREGVESTGSTAAEASPGVSQASDILNNPAFQTGTTTKLSPLSGSDLSPAYFDPSLMTEGLAWFNNLTIPDTTLALPGMLGLTMLVTALLRPTVGKPASSIVPKKTAPSDEGAREDLLPPNPGAARFMDYMNGLGLMQRFGILLSGVFVVIGMKLPVALLLYIIPSIGLGWLQSRWLDLKYPIPRPIRKCTRPLWRNAKRQWVNPRS